METLFVVAKLIGSSLLNISLLPSVKIKRMQWNRWVVDGKTFWKIVTSLASAL